MNDMNRKFFMFSFSSCLLVGIPPAAGGRSFDKLRMTEFLNGTF
jgi:hypothetical protein